MVRMTQGIRWGVVLLLALLVPVVALAGEEPLAGAFDAADVLASLSQAVGEGDPAAYARCLADSFRFEPLPEVAQEYPHVDWAAWNRGAEAAFAGEWLRGRRGRLAFPEILDKATIGGGRVEWDVLYRMEAQGRSAQGRATVVMVRQGQDWFLAEWLDTTRENDDQGRPAPTAGELRALIMW